MGVGQELVPELWERIVARFPARKRAIPESNRRQAHRPVGAESIPNARGTAPGFAFTLGGARFYALPGVPSEMRAMLTEYVLTDVARRFPAPAAGRSTLKCYGTSEAAVGELLQPYMTRGADPLVGITVSRGVHTISILGADEVKRKRVLDEIRTKLGSLVYSERDEDLEEAVGRGFLERGLTIALAESCTGGLATALLTRVPGISAVLREGIVAYSNEAKQARLGVSAGLLESHGAVSRECAAAMAEGARRTAGVDIGVSITGIAGPGGGTPEKPVGLVYVAVALEGLTDVVELHFAGLERDLVRELAAREALNRVRLDVLSRPVA
jgi:nicotinamide-nucleotide amidase